MVNQYTTAVGSPSRFQFEDNSGSLYASQVYNCGPTCVTRIAQFYRDTYYQIETTRRLAAECCRPTNAWEQRDMLIARGVDADVIGIDSIAQLRDLVQGGRRPIVIGVEMSRVPASVRDHDFTGWHAITVLDSVTLMDGTRGFWVNDPNFSPIGGYRPDPDKGRKFYPARVLNYAYIQNTPRFSVVPKRRKQVSDRYVMLKAGARILGRPHEGARLLRQVNVGRKVIFRFQVEADQYTYFENGVRKTDKTWANVTDTARDNVTGFVKKHYTEPI